MESIEILCQDLEPDGYVWFNDDNSDRCNSRFVHTKFDIMSEFGSQVCALARLGAPSSVDFADFEASKRAQARHSTRISASRRSLKRAWARLSAHMPRASTRSSAPGRAQMMPERGPCDNCCTEVAKTVFVQVTLETFKQCQFYETDSHKHIQMQNPKADLFIRCLHDRLWVGVSDGTQPGHIGAIMA